MTIKPPLAGQPISSSQWLQPVAAAINRLEHSIATGTRPDESPADDVGIESGAFVAEQSETITATRDSDGVLVTVAKPPNLRGNIGTRINSDGDTEEIFRAYSVGDVILIASVLVTGVAGVTFADINWAARRWTIEV